MTIAMDRQPGTGRAATSVLEGVRSGAATLILIAKETIPGRVKTRLHPALSYEQAAELAAASISDTIDATAALPFARRILAFDGSTPPPGTDDFDVIPQVAGDLDERLAAIFDECDGPAVLIGMDTPQLRASDLTPVVEQWPDDIDAWFGPSTDGGFWALAMREPNGDLIRGVPMSRDDTGALQLARLCEAGLKIGMLRPLTDVDTIDDARTVARLAPNTRFATKLASWDEVAR